MYDRPTLAQKLLDHYSSKAYELLIDYLKDDTIRAEAEQYIGRNDPGPSRPGATAEQHARSPRTRSHHPDSSLLQRTTRHSIPHTRHSLHTPPTSAGSVISHSSSLAAAGIERIYFISCVDGADRPVMSRCAPVKHNLIGDNVAYARGLGVARESVDEIVHVPLPSGGQKGENAKFAVTLTWRRSKETKTNMCAFYVVSSELLETDVILGSEDCLDRQIPPDVYEVHSPQVNYQREGFVEMEELVPAVSQHAPSVLRHIYHQNTMTPDTQRTHARVQALEDMRRTHATDSTTPTPQSKHKDSKSSTHTSTPLQGQASLSDQIQVSGFWGKTPIKMSFDPDAPGEAFYQAFYQWAVRRKRDGDLERHRMTLWLKASKNMPHEEAYDLRLEEDELENFWESAVDWIQENKNPKAPHLYATVEFEAV